MVDKNWLKKLSDADLERTTGELVDLLNLTDRRLAALKRRQARDPDWKAYDPMIDEEVGIDIRIEEQEAVRWEIEESLKIVDAEKVRRKSQPKSAASPTPARAPSAPRLATPQPVKQARLF